MKFGICTNLDNGAGLQRDYQLLRALLESFGHEVWGLQFNNYNDRRHVDIMVFLETVAPHLFEYANELWLVPNPEWLLPTYARLVDSHFTGILCKTHDCERIVRGLYSRPRIIYSSWLSPDLLDESVSRTETFLHVAGNSQTKNTEAVFYAWRRGTIPHQLIVLSRWYPNPGLPNVSVLNRVSDEEHKRLVNSCKYHLCPSQYEGFGHSINEACAVGAVVITLDAPPMNEFGIVPQLMVPSVSTRPYNQGTLHMASADNIVSAVQHALGMSAQECGVTGLVNRRGFLDRRTHFRKVLAELWGRC